VYYILYIDGAWEGALWGVWPTGKHRILGLGKRVSCAKTDGPILTIYTSYNVFLLKKLPFGGRDNCTCIKFLVALFFLAINALTRSLTR